MSDAVIARCQEWAAEHYADASPVAAMTKLSGLPERTFMRRFAKATGLSPLEYVHCGAARGGQADAGDRGHPVEAIALEVGYEDASFFNRLFRRKVGSDAGAISPPLRIHQTKPAASVSVASGSVNWIGIGGDRTRQQPTASRLTLRARRTSRLRPKATMICRLQERTKTWWDQ